ncbi:MAG: alpha/beta hydrolase [Fibrobacterota bacterium]|nr:alpha/beta hydrolase [Fibrobacterota bacterium]
MPFPRRSTLFAALLALAVSIHGAGAPKRIAKADGHNPERTGQVGAAGPDWEPLWPNSSRNPLDRATAKPPFLTHYAPRDPGAGTAVIVCPGGAYGFLARPTEGIEPALWLSSLGVHAFLLDYRLGPAFHHPAQMEDAQRAVRWVRANAKRFGIDPRRVGMLGFSAGGHLTATVATHHDIGKPASPDSVERVSSRPDFQILVYPVISMEAPFTHRASRTNLLGRAPDAATLAFLSAESQADANTPPAFIVHAESDPIVDFANSHAYAEALRRAKAPVEFLAFVHGGHGFGLATEKNGEPGQEQLATWPARCAAWMRARGFLGGKAPADSLKPRDG